MAFNLFGFPSRTQREETMAPALGWTFSTPPTSSPSSPLPNPAGIIISQPAASPRFVTRNAAPAGMFDPAPGGSVPTSISGALERVSTSPKQRDGPSRVAVLLDGDSDYFHRKYLGDVDGGRRAAIELHNQIEDFIQAKEGREIRPVIHTMIFMNMTGLAGFLDKGTPAVDLRAFAQGFNSSPFATSALDTGRGNQSADEALKNHLAVHIHTSDYLLLGGVHDSGYAATLHQLGRTIASKVILLQTTPVLAQPLADLKLEVLRFPPGLFDGHEPTFNRKGAFPTKAFHGVASTPPRVFPSTSPSKFASPHVSVPLSYASAASPPHTTPSAFTPSVHPRPVSPTKTAATSSSSIPSVFVPLVNLLRKQERMGNATPSRATIGATLKGSHPGLYAHFKEYSAEAERMGIVVLGSGQLIGTEWIRLANPSNSTITPSHATPHATATAGPAVFRPLISVLRQLQAQGQDQPIGSTVGSNLKAAYPNIYQDYGEENDCFKAYTHNARDAGIVKLGGSDGREWVALKAKYSITSSQSYPEVNHSTPDKVKKPDALSFSPSFGASLPFTSALASTLPKSTSTPSNLAPSPIPDKFVPLVKYLQKLAGANPPDLTPLRSKTSTALGSENPHLYESWKEYAHEAETLGIVEMGSVPMRPGSEWIRLKHIIPPSSLIPSSLIPSSLVPSSVVPSPSRPHLVPNDTPIPDGFSDLVAILRSLAARGVPKPLNSAVKQEIKTLYPHFYGVDSSEGGKVPSFRKFARKAVQAGVIEKGGEEGAEWVKLVGEFA